MSKVAAMIEQLREELVETRERPPEPKSGNGTREEKPTFQTEEIFAMPERVASPKVRIIIEIDATLGQRFKNLCRKHGWPQKDSLERFIKSFVEHHEG